MMKNTIGKIFFIIMLLTPLCVVAQDKVYKIGDYYNVNGVEGIVFYTTDNGRHGKIISMDSRGEGYYYWTTLHDSEFESFTTNASDEDDGQRNTERIKGLDNYSPEAFPAFACCIGKGPGWYLPAINEMREIANARAQDDLDAAIANAGGVSLKSYYWSSTERLGSYSKSNAWAIILEQGTVFGFTKHGVTYHVRPVHKF